MNYTEHELGCRLPFNRLFASSFADKNCSTYDEYNRYRQLLLDFENVTEQSLAKVSDCLPRCLQFQYQLDKKYEGRIKRIYP